MNYATMENCLPPFWYVLSWVCSSLRRWENSGGSRVLISLHPQRAAIRQPWLWLTSFVNITSKEQLRFTCCRVTRQVPQEEVLLSIALFSDHTLRLQLRTLNERVRVHEPERPPHPTGGPLSFPECHTRMPHSAQSP